MAKGCLFISLSNLSEFSTPVLVGWSIDAMMTERYSDVYWYMLYFFISVVITSIFTGLRARWFNLMSDRIERDIRDDLYKCVIYKDLNFFDRNRTGAIMGALVSEPHQIQSVLGANVSMFMRGLFLSVAILLAMAYTNLKLFYVNILSILPIIISGIISRGLLKNYKKEE